MTYDEQKEIQTKEFTAVHNDCQSHQQVNVDKLRLFSQVLA